MSDHLPECPLASDCKHDYYDEPPIQCANCGEECFCDRLRACEQRVRDEERVRAQLIAKEQLRETADSFDDYDYYMFAKEQYKDCYDRISRALRET